MRELEAIDLVHFDTCYCEPMAELVERYYGNGTGDRLRAGSTAGGLAFSACLSVPIQPTKFGVLRI